MGETFQGRCDASQCSGRCPCGSSSVLLLQTRWGVGGRGGICMHSTTKRRPGLCALAARARASRVVSVKGVVLGGPWRDIGAQRGALCLALMHRHRQHRPQGSHKGQLFLTVRGASVVGAWGGSSSWLARGRLLPGFCYSRETVLVSSFSKGTDPIPRTPPPPPRTLVCHLP